MKPPDPPETLAVNVAVLPVHIIAPGLGVIESIISFPMAIGKLADPPPTL